MKYGVGILLLSGAKAQGQARGLSCPNNVGFGMDDCGANGACGRLDNVECVKEMCVCMTGFMDANCLSDDGCEARFNEDRCPFGSCKSMTDPHTNAIPVKGGQCGMFTHLHCGSDAASACCRCDEGYELNGKCLNQVTCADMGDDFCNDGQICIDTMSEDSDIHVSCGCADCPEGTTANKNCECEVDVVCEADEVVHMNMCHHKCRFMKCEKGTHCALNDDREATCVCNDAEDITPDGADVVCPEPVDPCEMMECPENAHCNPRIPGCRCDKGFLTTSKDPLTCGKVEPDNRCDAYCKKTLGPNAHCERKPEGGYEEEEEEEEGDWTPMLGGPCDADKGCGSMSLWMQCNDDNMCACMDNWVDENNDASDGCEVRSRRRRDDDDEDAFALKPFRCRCNKGFKMNRATGKCEEPNCDAESMPCEGEGQYCCRATMTCKCRKGWVAKVNNKGVLTCFEMCGVEQSDEEAEYGGYEDGDYGVIRPDKEEYDGRVDKYEGDCRLDGEKDLAFKFMAMICKDRCMKGDTTIYYSDKCACCREHLAPKVKLCGANAHCDGRRCVCDKGYTGDGYRCCPIETRCDKLCTQKMGDMAECIKRFDADGVVSDWFCQCMEGSHLRDGKCHPDRECKTDEQCSGREVCAKGQCMCLEPNFVHPKMGKCINRKDVADSIDEYCDALEEEAEEPKSLLGTAEFGSKPDCGRGRAILTGAEFGSQPDNLLGDKEEDTTEEENEISDLLIEEWKDMCAKCDKNHGVCSRDDHGSFVCRCEKGYTMDPNGRCREVDGKCPYGSCGMQQRCSLAYTHCAGLKKPYEYGDEKAFLGSGEFGSEAESHCCECEDGWEDKDENVRNGCEHMADPCLKNDCVEMATCHSAYNADYKMMGYMYKCMCPEGFTGNGHEQRGDDADHNDGCHKEGGGEEPEPCPIDRDNHCAGKNRCDENAECHMHKDCKTYHCTCNDGFVGDGYRCKEEKPEGDVCDMNFFGPIDLRGGGQLFGGKQNAITVKVSTQLAKKSTPKPALQLGRGKYTAILTLDHKKCGKDFVKAFSEKDAIKVYIQDRYTDLDTPLYTVYANAFFMRRPKVTRSGIFIQVNKNFPTLCHMHEEAPDKAKCMEWLEEDQKFNAKGSPNYFDTFRLTFEGSIINKKYMADTFRECFNTQNWDITVAEEWVSNDITKCMIRGDLNKVEHIMCNHESGAESLADVLDSGNAVCLSDE